jgi:uncharacterized repeat protein (TIGR03803 family)
MKLFVFAIACLSLSFAASAVDRVELVENLSRSGENPSGRLVIAADGKYYGTAKNGGTNGFGCIYRFDAATGNVTTVASFGSSTGRFPNGELLDGGDGFLYGTARQGGTGDFGTIFRVKLSDGTLTKLAQFDGVNSGKFPLGGLIKVGSRYYGVASEGGASDKGTVFKLTPVAGTTNWDLGAFSTFTGGANGSKPWGTLVDSGGGVLIGTTELGGDDNRGCIFKVPTAGASARIIEVIKSFAGGASDGANPRAGLWKSKADGFFYGTTFAGGANNLGAVYRISSLGTNFQIVANMELSKGSRPLSGLVEPPVADGFLYGTCSEGGANGAGSVIKLSRDSSGAPINPDNVASFNTTDGSKPVAALLFGPDGLAYGTTEQGGVAGLGSIFRITSGVSLRTAASFVSGKGANPRSALSAGADGTLYGSTFDGGTRGDGTIFRLTKDGTYSVLANFTGADGANPLSPLIVSDDGTIFGSTYKGGSNERGTIFRVTADGTVQPLVKFNANLEPKGANPRGAIVRIGNDFFGTTEKGGANDKGTIFKVSVNPLGSPTPATLTTLLDFNGSNGEFPFAGLTNDGNGVLYGTTTKGGANGFGTFFKITTAGVHTKIYDFTTQNPTPASALVKDPTAQSPIAFYGTSDPSLYEPAAGSGNGTIFKITSAGVLTTLHPFTGATNADGRGPRGLALISNSLLAGVTYGGGGSLYTMPTSGAVPTTVYRFDDDYVGNLKASRPEAAPFLAPDGGVYGSSQKSSGGGGTIFRLLNSPTASVTSVSETAPESAIARGLVNPNGETINVFFEYSLSPSFGTVAATTTQVFSGTTTQVVAADLASLTPGATYYVRLKAGSKESSTFVYGPPSATTGAATGIGARVATLRATVNPNGRDTSVQFQYGFTTSYGSSITLGSIGNGSESVVIEADLAALQPSSIYHYRIVATNADGTTEGANATFSTGMNSLPIAIPLFGLTTSLTAPVTIDLPTNLDPDLEVVTFSFVNQPSFGSVALVNNNRFVYTPGPRFKGFDSFTYRATDPGNVGTNETVTIRNPFVSLKGSYLTYITNPQGEPLGSLKLTVSGTGGFTGTLLYGGSFPVKGTFDPARGIKTGTPTISIPRPGKTPLVVSIRIDTTSEKGNVEGSVNDGVSAVSFVSDARLLAPTAVTPHAGRYTVWFRPPSTMGLPEGNGWATLSVNSKGVCAIAGKAGDGTPFTSAPTLRTTDSVLVNIPLYSTQPAAGRGYIFGELFFRNKPGSDADGNLKWKRGPQPKSFYFPTGFGPEPIVVLASRWVPLQALPGTHRIDLTGGGLADNEPNNLPASFNFGIPNISTGISKATVVSTNVPENVKLSANLKTGAFTGTFIHPDAGITPRAFGGVLYQKQNTGVGVFLGTATSGAVTVDLQ